MPELLQQIFSDVWSIALAIFLLGCSVFVHELGHFLAARRRGLKVDRFSIGFGPKIFGWTRGGVEYRVSWIPLGGYVALPQLADMSGIEGPVSDEAKAAPTAPMSYSSKMIVLVMGATFNVLFAFALASVLWAITLPVGAEETSTRIGYISPTVRLPDGRVVPSPALEAGLQIGDTVKEIDGERVADWSDLVQTVLMGGHRSEDGRREATFLIERNGKLMEMVIHPELAGSEGVRRIGIAAYYDLLVGEPPENAALVSLGLKPGDTLVAVNGQQVVNHQTLFDILEARRTEALSFSVSRDGKILNLPVPPRANQKENADLARGFTSLETMVRVNPFAQIANIVRKTFQTLASLLNPGSDVGLSKMSGPVGIIDIFHQVARTNNFRAVLWLVILVNVNLAVMNLLPIPVLDGGHMLFATIGKIRGRNLPANFLAAAQSLFVLLLFSTIIYVSFFYFRRIVRRNSDPT
jgi:regulator of sigma E protease